MERLRVMILCGRSPRHLYVANRLCRACEPVAIVQETGGEDRLAKLWKLIRRPRRLFEKFWRWLRDRRRYVGGQEARYFFGDARPKLDRKDLLVEVPSVNHPDVVALADRLQPDLIAVFGTSLIKGDLLEQGRLGMVNLHGGISPQYRGADCTFWALYNGEPEMVGCTLHFIDPGIDSGDLIAHVHPEVRPGDTELELFWRAVRGSAEIYAELLERMAQGERFGQKQPGKGRLYRVRDRGWRHERSLDRRIEGMLAQVKLPLRVRWYPRET